MIKVTRINGKEFFINPHQIENIESTPDTIITLLSGQKYIVKESIDNIVKDVIEYRHKISIISVEQEGNE